MILENVQRLRAALNKKGLIRPVFCVGGRRCLGHLLAKMEMQSFYKAPLERTSDIQLNGALAWIHATFVTGLRKLPVLSAAS